MSERRGADSGSPLPLGTALHRWFLRPPRPHGEVIEDRTVSFLELFYDLVYVVLIGQIAHTLAEDVSWSGVVDFAVVFGLIWIGWFNGAQFHELHGREDGRNRSFIFPQTGAVRTHLRGPARGARLAVGLRVPDRQSRVPPGGVALSRRSCGGDRCAAGQRRHGG